MGYSRYSREFKDAVITKVLNRGDQTLTEICQQEGIGLSAARSLSG